MAKVTKNERYAQLLAIEAVAQNAELVAFIEHEQELLAKKNVNGERKMTKKQEGNAGLKEMIYASLSADGRQTISQLIPKLNSNEEITHGRVVALLTQLRNENRIVREKCGKETYEKVVDGKCPRPPERKPKSKQVCGFWAFPLKKQTKFLPMIRK